MEEIQKDNEKKVSLSVILNSQETSNIILSKKSLIKAAKLCLQNAKQFIDDAKLLISQKSYGHAFSLAALAEEEISKALIYYAEAMGLKGDIDKKEIYNHNFKQAIAGMNTLFEIIIFSLFDKMFILEKIKDPNKLRKRRDKIVWGHINKMKNAMKSGTKEYYEMEKNMNHFKSLERHKQRGFYVDIDEKGTILSPKDISYREAKFCIDLAYKRYQKLSHLETKESNKIVNKLTGLLVSKIKLSIYNTDGELLRTVNGGTIEAGKYRIKWDKRDNQGKVIPSGTYPCILSKDNKVIKKDTITLQ